MTEVYYDKTKSCSHCSMFNGGTITGGEVQAASLKDVSVVNEPNVNVLNNVDVNVVNVTNDATNPSFLSKAWVLLRSRLGVMWLHWF